jgi:hypothetical protein
VMDEPDGGQNKLTMDIAFSLSLTQLTRLLCHVKVPVWYREACATECFSQVGVIFKVMLLTQRVYI